MDLEHLIGQLAFGKTAPEKIPALGMYLSPEAVFLAETRLNKGRIEVKHLVRVPVPQKPGDAKGGAKGPSTLTLDTDFMTDNAKLVETLRQSLSQNQWGTKNVMVTLSHHMGILRYFSMPAIERRFWRSAVPLEAKKYIPLPFESLSQDFQVFPLPDGADHRPRSGVLFSVTQNKNLARIAQLVSSLGLKLVGVETAPCSVVRLWEQMESLPRAKPYCHVHFDGGDIRILIIENGVPIFFREVFLGVQPSIQDQRRLDLGGCVAFVQKQFGVGHLDEVRVSGSGTALEAWQQAFSQELGVKASLHNAAGALGLKAGGWAGYAALGATLRFLGHAPIALDLAKIGQISDEDRRTAQSIFTLSGIVALWFLAVGLMRYGEYFYQLNQLAKYKIDPSVQAVFAGKTSNDITEIIKSMQSQSTVMQKFIVPGAAASHILKDAADSIPENVWIANISYANPIDDILSRGSADNDVNSGPQLEIKGHAMADDISQEQNLAYKYKDALGQSPVIGHFFRDIEITVNESNVSSIVSPGAMPASPDFSQQRQERTSFTLTAKTKRL